MRLGKHRRGQTHCRSSSRVDGKILPFLAEPLWVGDGAVKVMTGFVKFELASFRSLCRLCEKSRNLGRVHRLETAGGV
jgi:hypothetical protein